VPRVGECVGLVAGSGSAGHVAVAWRSKRTSFKDAKTDDQDQKPSEAGRVRTGSVNRPEKLGDTVPHRPEHAASRLPYADAYKAAYWSLGLPSRSAVPRGRQSHSSSGPRWMTRLSLSRVTSQPGSSLPRAAMTGAAGCWLVL
jgi:hypothetical protein